jgi:hypothetical protein
VPEAPPAPRRDRANGALQLVHVTVHPGLEGTAMIRNTVQRLRDKGHPIELRVLSWVTPAEVLAAFAEADLAIGKMKMGYYANADRERP